MGTFIQPSFAKGEVSPRLFGRVDTAAYKIGLSTARNVVVKTSGGVINRPGLEFIGFSKDMANTPRLRRFRFNTTDTYMLEFSAGAMRVIRDDAHVTEALKTVTSINNANPGIFIIPAHGYSVGDDLNFSVFGMFAIDGRRFRVASVLDANTITVRNIMTNAIVDTTLMTTFISGTAARLYTLATPYAQADLATLKFVQSASVMTITHPTYPEGYLTRTGDAAWTLTNPTFAPSILAPTSLTVTPVSTGTTSYAYQVTALSATTGEESLPSTAALISNGNATANNTLAWTAVAGASQYSVYKAQNGVYGFIGISPASTFTDSNMAPALSITPPAARNPFSAVGSYPGCSTYYQQRHVRAGSTSAPAKMFYSRVGNFYNMTVSTPSQAGDAITASLTSREVNAVRHMVPSKDLLVFSSGGEWRITSTGAGFSASTIDQLPQSSWGCSHLEPILIGLTTLFVPENQTSVRSFSYAFANDAYTGQEVTLVSGHLFERFPLVDWGYSRSPDPVVYGVRDDGQATAFTYHEEQQVNAWARWDTQGSFEAVDVVRPNGSSPDELPYFCVSRVTAAGNVIRTIERLHSRRFTDVRDCFFVDAGLTYDVPSPITAVTLGAPITITSPGHGIPNGTLVDISDIVWAPVYDALDTSSQPAQLNNLRFTTANGTATTFDLVGTNGAGYAPYVSGGNARVPVKTVTGLDHLEGSLVQVLADGNVVSDVLVVGGAIVLPTPASRIQAGLKYVSDVCTLNLEAPQGTMQGKFKRATASLSGSTRAEVCSSARRPATSSR